MIELVTSILSLAFLAQVLGVTVPYAMAALGGVTSERSGVINIALEGMLLMGAFGAAVAAYEARGLGPDASLAVGLAGGALGGVVIAALYALVVVRFGADQIVAGVAINMLAYGLTRYLLKLLYDSISNSPKAPGLADNALSSWVFWGLALLAAVVCVAHARTPWGLRLRAAGEHPQAAHTLGVSIAALRWRAVLIAGALAGLGGAWLALRIGGFVAEMSSGRGYIALAAVIMGGWRPHWALAACLLFGFAEAVRWNLEISQIGLPRELAQIFPYLLTMITLAGFIGRSRAPAALGKPYEPH